MRRFHQRPTVRSRAASANRSLRLPFPCRSQHNCEDARRSLRPTPAGSGVHQGPRPACLQRKYSSPLAKSRHSWTILLRGGLDFCSERQHNQRTKKVNALFLLLAWLTAATPIMAQSECRMCSVRSQCSSQNGGAGNYEMRCANSPNYIAYSCCNDPGYVSSSMGSCSGWRMSCLFYDEVAELFRDYEFYCCSCDENCTI